MRLYAKFLSMHLKRQMQYKASFTLSVTAHLAGSAATLLGVWFMLERFHAVDGFTAGQAFVCYAAILAAFSLSEMFGRAFDLFPGMLGNGGLDRVLVRPRGVIFQVLASDADFTRAARLVQAAAVLAFAIPRCGVEWTWDRGLALTLMIGCGSVVFFSLLLLYAAFSFFTVEGLEFMNILTHGGCEFGRYPFSVYGRGVLRFLTFVVPLALVQHYPLLYLLGREQSPLFLLAPLASLLFLAPCLWFFRFGLRRHRSTGS
jgi:ABC-2 type transport system permease protein